MSDEAASRSHHPVLLVEDNPDVQEIIALLLEREGHAVARADNGREALDLLSSGMRPSLILLDYHMPIMDGRMFRLEQLAAGLCPRVPVILYSADPTIVAADLMVEVVLRKALEFDDILSAVDRVCGSAAPPPGGFDERAWNDFFAAEADQATQYLDRLPGLIARDPGLRVIETQHLARRHVAERMHGRVVDLEQAEDLLRRIMGESPPIVPDGIGAGEFARLVREYAEYYRRRMRGDSWL